MIFVYIFLVFWFLFFCVFKFAGKKGYVESFFAIFVCILLVLWDIVDEIREKLENLG